MKNLFFAVCMLASFHSFSQTIFSVNYNQTPLKEVLADIEKKTNLLFSYSEEAIQFKTITLVDGAITEAQLLSELKNQTQLDFEKVSENEIIISVPVIKVDVCGYLLDAKTKETLPFASVIVKGTTNGTSTDDSGIFQFEDLDQRATISIQYIGYAQKTIKVTEIKPGDCIKIYLQPETQSLQEIILLTEYITDGIDKNTDGSLTIRNNDLGILPGLVEPDVFQSLQLIPGISSLDESASDIQVRGGSPDQNLIYFDGIKMYHTGHFFGMISAINPYVIKKTKIYKGGASPQYGDRISGVLDISSEEGVPNITSAGIGANGTHADAFIKTPIGNKVGLIASARRSYTDEVQTPTFDALSEKVFQNTKVVSNNLGQVTEEDPSEAIGRQEFFFYDGNAKLIIQPSKNDNIAISGFFANNDLDFSVRDDEDVTTDKLLVEKQGASFSWVGTKFNKWHHSFKAYYTNLNTDYNNKVFEELFLEEENLRKNIVEDYGLDANLTFDITNTHAFKLGYQYSNANVSFQLFRNEADANDIDPEDEDNVVLPNTTRDFNVKRKAVNQAHSIYAEYLHTSKNKGFIGLGVRGSHYSSVGEFYIEPRINAEYPISKVFRLKATAEKRYQPISQLVEFEDVQLRLEDHIWTISNGMDIPVLESTQFSGGILLNKDGWALDIDGYIKNIEGLTSFTNGFTNDAEEISEGKSDIVGFDVLIRKKVKNYRIWLGYTFNDVTYTFPELQRTSFRGNNDITHNFRVSNTYKLNNWELSLGWMYRTGSPFTPAESFNGTTKEVNFGAINSFRLPDYHRLDASLLYNIALSKRSNFKGTIGASLQNIYSRQVPISVSYRVDENTITGEDELNRIQQLSLGFTPNVTVRLFF